MDNRRKSIRRAKQANQSSTDNLPVIFIPDDTCLSKEGFLWADKAIVIKNKKRYDMLRAIIGGIEMEGDNGQRIIRPRFAETGREEKLREDTAEDSRGHSTVDGRQLDNIRPDGSEIEMAGEGNKDTD